MNKPLRILMVEDNPDDAELSIRELKRANLDFSWERVDTEPEFLIKLKNNPDVIIADYDLPSFNGFRALELLKQHTNPHIPFIIVSGTIGEESAVAAMQQGASDYVLKDRITRLGESIRRALEFAREKSERRRFEAQFIESQKMEVIGQLAGGVAHDFNNVLGVIMGYSDLIVQEPDPQNIHKFNEEIRLAAKRAAGLTQQLLIFSRKEEIQHAPVDLNEAIREMDKMLVRLIDENIELQLNLADDLPPVTAHSGYIWQLLMNLVVNARDAMQEGGKLTIRSQKVILSETPDNPPRNYVELSVRDTGMGMSDEIKGRIFDAFYTTKPAGKGTGLGLVTCQTIMRQCQGYIEVDSSPGNGTTFRIYFPVHDVMPVQNLTKTGRLRILKKGTETLLVVEDDPSLRHLAQNMLESQGYRVLSAPNGQDALRVAREHKGDPISLVMTDVVMPRMGGKIMADWLKASFPNLKVLYTSGYTADVFEEDERQGEKIDFLPKPYTAASLGATIRQILDR